MAAPEPVFVSGRRGCIYFNGLNLSKFFESFDLGQTKGTIEANTMRSNAKRKLDDLPDSTATGAAFWDPQKRAVARELDKSVIGTALSNIIWLPGGDGFGKEGYAGLYITSDNSVSGATGAAVGVSFAAEGSESGREFLEILFPLSDMLLAASPLTGETLDDGAASSLGGSAYLQVMEMDGSGDLDVTINESTDDFSADDTLLTTFDTVTAASDVITSIPHQRIELAEDAAIKQYLRIEATITTATRVRFVVGFSRRAAIFN